MNCLYEARLLIALLLRLVIFVVLQNLLNHRSLLAGRLSFVLDKFVNHGKHFCQLFLVECTPEPRWLLQ